MGQHKTLHKCDECGERRFIAWIEQNRASRPKCYGCGSAQLTVVSEDAKSDMASLQRIRVAGGTHSVQLQGKDRRKLNTKVT